MLEPEIRRAKLGTSYELPSRCVTVSFIYMLETCPPLVIEFVTPSDEHLEAYRRFHHLGGKSIEFTQFSLDFSSNFHKNH